MVKYEPAALRQATHTAYFDAGGHPCDQDSVFLSGLVSSVDKWLRFEAAWTAALKAEGLNVRFHMKAFVFGERGYEAWKDNDKKRAETAERLLKVVKRHIQKKLYQRCVQR